MQYPMKMRPAFRDYLWGGKLLQQVYHKKSGFEITAESWELSAIEPANSVIEGGVYAGLLLAAISKSIPRRWGAAPGGVPRAGEILDADTLFLHTGAPFG